MDFLPFVRLRHYDGCVYSAAEVLLRKVDALRRKILSQRELRRTTQARWSDTLVRPIASFHGDPRYGGDLHRADMAWALHAASHGLSGQQIEQEILNEDREAPKFEMTPQDMRFLKSLKITLDDTQ